MTAPHIYVTRSLPGNSLSALHSNELPAVESPPDTPEPPSRAELLSGVAGAEAVLSMVTDRIDAEFLEAAGPQLKIVANMGVGYDNIDLHAAAQRAVTITNTPGVLDDAVADLTMGLLLGSVRRIAEADRFIRSGTAWTWGPRDFVGLDVSAGAVLGIVGLGRIGMAVARRAQAFGMRILATGSRATSEEARALGVVPSTLDDLLPHIDVLSLHCPLDPSTRHLISAAQMQSMRPGSWLINTARGPLVDEEALADALENGHLAGAGLDVHEFEPQVNERLMALDQVVLLPHIGSAGDATRHRMATLAARNIAEVLAGRGPLTPVALPGA
ncbi:D-glycerate dehydrogenase [Nesterenkonia rhizosphaerae]|uniref:D-glycerate dehydrogenase n=1 Tax=Nesterenkonia rhizosphaerae TaxID=1348272 RepID=A0ABP9GDC7_9MICC